MARVDLGRAAARVPVTNSHHLAFAENIVRGVTGRTPTVSLWVWVSVSAGNHRRTYHHSAFARVWWRRDAQRRGNQRRASDDD